MLSTITAASDENILVLTKRGAVLCGWDGSQQEVELGAPGVVAYRDYVVTEDKTVYQKIGDRLVPLGTTPRMVSTVCSERATPRVLYAADRLGSVYCLGSAGRFAPKFLFGSISMITDMCITPEHIITVDKDSKIRVTKRAAPHIIEEFIMVHSRPLLGVCLIADSYLVSGGYDEYLSIYQLATKATFIYSLAEGKLQEYHRDALPGVADASSIPNINPASKCRVKKILALDNTLVLLGPEQAAVLTAAFEPAGPALTRRSVPDLEQLAIEDGWVAESKGVGLFITQTGELFQYTPKTDQCRLLAKIATYTPGSTLAIISKTLQHK